MNNLPVTVQAVADTSRAAKSLENLTRKREVVLAASIDAKSIAAANKPLGAIKRSADEFEKSMAAANARVLAFGTSVAVIEGMRRSFLALIKTTADVQEALTKINIVGGEELRKVGKTLDSVGKDIFDLAKRTGQSFDVASKAFLEFTRQGLGPVETLKRTEVALNVARVSGEEYSNVVEGLTAAFNSFKQSGLDYTKIADKIVAVDNAAAVSAGQLIEGLKRSSATAQQAGTNIDELIATITVLQEVTARGGGVIGNSIKSISTRLQRPDVLKYLEEINVQVRDVDNGKLLNQIAILKNVSDKLQTIDDTSKRFELAEKISGLYQIDQLNAFVRALQDASSQGTRFEQIMRESAKAGGELSQASAQFSQNLVNKFAAVDTTVQRVLNSLGKIGIIDPLSGLLDSFVEVGEGFSKFLDGNEIGSGLAKGIVKGLGGVLLGPTGIVTVGFIIAKIIKDFGVFAFDAAKSFLSLNKTAKDQELIQKSILTTISQMPSILNGIENTESGRLLLAQRVTAEYEKQLAAQKLFNELSAGASKYVYGQGVRVGDKGITKIKGSRAASGYLPDLISQEIKDVRSGVGGANPNSKIVVMPNFPFGGGKKGLMVANSSEIAMKMGDGYGILNPEMMGQRSAKGFLAGQKVKTASGKYASINNIEAGLENLVQLLVGYEKTLPEIREAAKNFAKSFQLNEKSLDLVVEASVKYASSVKEAQARIIRETNQEAIRKAIGKADQTIRSAPEKRAAANIPLIMASGSPLLNRPSPRDIENALKESSLKMIVEAADAVNQKIFDGILEKRKQIAEYIKKNPPNPLALGLSRTSLPGRDLSGNPTFAYLNQPIRYSGPTSSDPLTRATEIGRQREIDRLATQQRGLSVAPTLVEAARIRQNYQYNQTAAFGGSQRLAAQNLPSSVILPAEIVNKAKTSLESFAIKTFAASAIVDIVGAQFRGMSEKTDKLIDAFSRATLAVAGFAFLNKSGGLTFGKAFEGAGNLLGGAGKKVGGGIIGRAVGATSSGVSTAIGAISTLGKSLVRFLPIIGQISLAGFVVNEFSKVFSDKSIFDRIYQAFGGLSDSAEKAKEKFNEVAAQIFDPSGQYVGRSLEERRGSLSQTRESAIKSLRAQSRGVKVSGKTPQEVEAENFRQLLLEGIGGIETGKIVDINPIDAESRKFQQTISGVGSLGLSESAKETILQVLQDVTSGTLEELRTLASSKGIQEIGGIPTAEAKRENIQKALAKAFVEQFIKERVGKNFDLESVIEGEVGRARLAGAALNFSGSNAKSSIVSDFVGRNLLSKELLDSLSKFQSELSVLLIDGAISSLESQVRGLEFRASGEVSSAEKNRLLRAADKITAQIYSKQLEKLGKEFQSEVSGVKTDNKTPIEISSEIGNITQKYQNQVREIGYLISATQRETKAREEAFSSFQRLNPVITNLERALSKSAIGRARSESDLSLIQARGSNPALGISAQEDYQRAAAAKQLELLQRDLSDAKISRDLALKNAEKLPPDDQLLEKSKIEDSFKAQKESINGQIAALNETTKQIGAIKSSFTSLNDAILQFSRGLGESRGQNQFNLLQATDASSISQGLIGERVYGAAEGKSGQDLVTFIADQNALLNEQFKIRTASSASERLELERQLELTTELLEIKNKNLDPAQKQLEIEKAINNNLEKRRTFGAGVQDAVSGMKDRIQTFNSDFGKAATEGFKESLSSAIKAAVSETDNLKDALLDVALQFANSLRDKAIDNLSDVITSKLFSGGGNSGGGIISGILGIFGGGKAKGYATGGLITGGSGTKDDVPTLLMGGEYVVPKDIVRQYGKSFFDRLRDGSIGKMAQGGYFAPGVRGQGTISGKENLLDFATQTATSGKGDITSSLSGGAGIVSLEPESLRLSNFARFGDSPIVNATQEAKDQAFSLYLDQLGQEKEYAQQLEEIRNAEQKRKKELKKQFLMSIASAVIGAGLSYGLNGTKAPKALDPNKPYTFNAKTGLYQTSANKNLLPEIVKNIAPQQLPNGVIKTKGDGFYNPYNSSVRDVGLSLPEKINGQRINYQNFLLPPIKRNAGGYAGSGDTIPAMLSNKEFVLNSAATQKIGDKNLYALNNGLEPNSSNGEMESKIIAKLDELINKTIGASNVNVTVNMENGKSNNRQDNQENGDQNQRQLAQKIKETVVNVIREEQRPGGLLTSTRR